MLALFILSKRGPFSPRTPKHTPGPVIQSTTGSQNMMKQASPVLDDDVVVAHDAVETGLGGDVFNEKLDDAINDHVVVTTVDIVVPENVELPPGPADGGVGPPADNVKGISAIPNEVAPVKATDTIETQTPVSIPLPTQNGINKVATASAPPANGPTGTSTSASKKPGPPRPDPARLAALSSTINSNLILLSSAQDGPDCETARVKAAAAAQELTNALRAPPESVMNWFINASIVSVVRLFQHWGVFDALPMPAPGLPPSEQGMPVSILAAKVEAEESIFRKPLSFPPKPSQQLTPTSPPRLHAHLFFHLASRPR